MDMTRARAAGRRLWHRIELARRSARSGRELGRRLGRISPENRATARKILRHFQPRKAPMPLIRIGPERDGGYLLPDDLGGIKACFSPGVSSVTGFDDAIAARGIPCFLADASVEGPVAPPEGMTFEPLFLGAETKGAVISLDDWVTGRAPEAGDLVLQMDIEGAEYATLGAASDAVLARFRIVVVEYHDLWRAFLPEGRDALQSVFDKMARHFVVVHLHGNNFAPSVRFGGMRFPPVVEVTYLRRDRAGETAQEPVLPHPLDRPNNRTRPDVALPRFWRG